MTPSKIQHSAHLFVDTGLGCKEKQDRYTHTHTHTNTNKQGHRQTHDTDEDTHTTTRTQNAQRRNSRLYVKAAVDTHTMVVHWSRVRNITRAGLRVWVVKGALCAYVVLKQFLVFNMY